MRDLLRKLKRRVVAPFSAVIAAAWTGLRPSDGLVAKARYEAFASRKLDRSQWRAWFQANRRVQRQLSVIRRLTGNVINPKSAGGLPRWLIEATRPQPIAKNWRRDRRKEFGPSGQSFRSLKRAVNAGWTPRQPNRKAMERHTWFQKKLHGARLRISYGQELPGDRELVAA